MTKPRRNEKTQRVRADHPVILEALEQRLLLSVGGPPWFTDCGVSPSVAVESETVHAGLELLEATDVSTTVTVNWGNGPTDSKILPAGQIGVSFDYIYYDDTPSGTWWDQYDVVFTTSNVYGSDTGSTTVKVENVDPTITSFNPDRSTINEGESITVTGAFTDPGPLDRFDVEVYWDYNNSSVKDQQALLAGERSYTATHTYADENTDGYYFIYTHIHDDDTHECENTGAYITVNDVGPDVTSLSVAESPVDYKTPVQVSCTFTDPGVLDDHYARIDWGDGSEDTTLIPPVGQRSFTRSHSYAAPAAATQTFTINVTLQGYDKANDGYPTDSGTVQVTIENHDPDITSISLDSSTIDENDTAQLSVEFTDYTPNDTHIAQIDWGDGSPVATLFLAPGSRSFTAPHQYLDDNPTATPSDVNTISVTIIDADSNEDTETIDITVNNLAPQITTLSLSETAIDENDTVDLSVAFTEVGTQDTHMAQIDWGDGPAVQTLFLAPGSRSFTIPHTYLDDNPTATPHDDYTIDVIIVDDDTGEDTGATTITVLNVDPIIETLSSSAPGVGDAAEGDTVTVAGTFSDVGTLDTHTGVIDWGDGTVGPATIVQGAGSGSISGSHVYTASGIYTITVTLTDDDTGQVTEETWAVISGAGVVDGVLYVIGTDANDRVTINAFGRGRANLKVHANFLPDRGKWRAFSVAGDEIERIVVLVGDGNDKARIAGNVALPAVMDGGQGNDKLKAGRGPAVLTGAEGNDKLIGGSGRDILIGGTGKDRLVGGRGDDILIGGYTTHDPDDDNLTADFDLPLLALLAEWDSEDDFDTRVGHLDGTIPGGLNGGVLLDATTVFDDGLADRLTGSSGRDWLLES